MCKNCNNVLQRQLAGAVADNIASTTPGFEWRPHQHRAGRGTAIMAVLIVVLVLALAAYARSH